MYPGNLHFVLMPDYIMELHSVQVIELDICDCEPVTKGGDLATCFSIIEIQIYYKLCSVYRRRCRVVRA